MTKHLQHIVKLEGLNYTPWALDTVVRISEWCVRDAIKYIDQVSILWDINEEHITKFLGIASESIIKNFLNLIKNKDRDAIFSEIDAINEQGVDMHNFAKQTLMYIDQYLSEDTDFLLAVSEIFTEILGTIKYYPYPAIVYKIAINKFLNPSAPVEIAIPRPVQTQAAEAKAETTNTKPVAQAWDSNLLAQLLARVDKPSLQKNLGEHIIIDSVEDDKVHIIVINKLTHTLLEKRENLEYLEKILSEVLNKPITLKVSFEKKEEYFWRKLTTNN